MCLLPYQSIFSRKRLTAGFTLLELLVVLFIIGIALGGVGIAIGTATENKLLHNHANNLIAWLNQTRNLATISNNTYRVQPGQSGHIVVQNYRENEWQDAEIDHNQYRLPDAVRIEWRFENDDITELSLYSNFTYTPFDLLIEERNGNSVIVVGNGVSPPVIQGKDS